jgi:uncharacterized protein
VLKVVCDTNIYVSAYLFPGIVPEILRLAQQGKFHLFVSPDILDELTAILVRKFAKPESYAREVAHHITSFASVVLPTAILTVIKSDPADNRILECAVEAGADIIISGDAALKNLRIYQGIDIVSPRQFLEGRWMSKAA